jgi:hypothetical protein
MLIVSILIFCIVLFIYLHINFHLKQSNDLEVYEIDQPSKQRLEEVCDIRQPTTFEYYNEQLHAQLSYQAIHNMYRAFDIHIRDVSKNTGDHDRDRDRDSTQKKSYVSYIPVPLKIAHEVLKNDTERKYISENNADFIEETGLIKTFQLCDEFLRPYMVSKCMYDILLGSENTVTPLRYNLNYRNYFLVTQGTIRLKLIPPKDARYLYPIMDYDILEFRSPVNPWKVQPEYQDDFDKIKTLEIELYQGMVVFIPAYWWYSIQFIGSETTVCSFQYRTHMNTLSIIPQLALHLLQTLNTRSDTLEKHVNEKEMFKTATTAPIAAATTPITAPAQPPEYTPSIEDQYLPKSIRGNNNNPYSIMNAVTETIQKPGAATTSTAAAATTAANDPIPSTSIEVETVVESTQKEVVIEPIQTLSSSSTVNHAL